MKQQRNRGLPVILATLVLVSLGALVISQNANAAGDGKIGGTVKLDGTAPHMRGIDMSKDPFCVKAHANDLAHSENVVVGNGGGLENVVLYISEGLSASEAQRETHPNPSI